MKLFSCLAVIVVALFSILFFPQITYAEGSKRVEVDLTTQTLKAFEGNTIIYEFTISSGKPWTPTPTGTFIPWVKVPSQTMSGGSKELGTYYNLPNVQHVVYFYKDYAIHGAYWHSNFGIPMSHGCINLKNPDADKFYSWVEMTTPITITGNTPS